MKAVITGDIINSRQGEPGIWLGPLKELLNEYGDNPATWEIYRGDSFQVMLDRPEEAIMVALRIKSLVKSIEPLDARLAVGIGEVDYQADRVTESNGDAFIRSGETFDLLKKREHTLSIKTPWKELDEELNILTTLAFMAIDDWSTASAQYVNLLLGDESLNQEGIGKALGITQSSVSERRKRAHLSEVLLYEQRCHARIAQHLTG